MDIIIITPDQGTEDQVLAELKQIIAALNTQGWRLGLSDHPLTIHGVPGCNHLQYKFVRDMSADTYPECPVWRFVSTASVAKTRALFLQDIQDRIERTLFSLAYKMSGDQAMRGALETEAEALRQRSELVTRLMAESPAELLSPAQIVHTLLIYFIQRHIYRFESEIALTLHTLTAIPERVSHWAQVQLELDYARVLLQNVQQHARAKVATAATDKFITHQQGIVARLEVQAKTLGPESWFSHDSTPFFIAERKLAVLRSMLSQLQKPEGLTRQCISAVSAEILAHAVAEQSQKRYRDLLNTLFPSLHEALQKCAEKMLFQATAKVALLLELKEEETTKDIDQLTQIYSGNKLFEHLMTKLELTAINRVEHLPEDTTPLSLGDYLNAVLDKSHPCFESLHLKRGLTESLVITGLERIRATLTNLVSLAGPEFAPLLPAEAVYTTALQVQDSEQRAAYLQQHFIEFRTCRAFQTELAARFKALLHAEITRYQAKKPWGVDKMRLVNQKIGVLQKRLAEGRLEVPVQLARMLFQYDPDCHILWQRLHSLDRRHPEIIARLLELHRVSYDPQCVTLTAQGKVNFTLAAQANFARLFPADARLEPNGEHSPLGFSSPALNRSSESGD